MKPVETVAGIRDGVRRMKEQWKGGLQVGCI
jgi:hypothetical protein